jgi:hypothetical protein
VQNSTDKEDPSSSGLDLEKLKELIENYKIPNNQNIMSLPNNINTILNLHNQNIIGGTI